MAQVANPRKVFNFKIEINGLDQFEVQKVTLPEVEVETTSHGDANSDVKTGGRIKVGDMTLEKLKPLPGSDTFAWDWLMRVQNPATGGGQLPDAYKQTIVIKELSTDGKTTVNRWIYTGAFVKKISQSDLDRNSSDNIIQTIILSVDRPSNT